MIHELKGRRLFTPVRLINSIVRWILGVHSPSGTIRVHNTALPSKERSLALDVDMEAVFSDVEKRLDGRGFSAAQRERIRDVVHASIDGTTLVWTDAGAAINEAWLERLVEGLVPEIPVDTAQQPASAPAITSGVTQGTLNAFDSGGFVAGAAGGAGCTIYVLCEARKNGTAAGLYVRPFTITSDGRIWSIGGESAAVAVSQFVAQ